VTPTIHNFEIELSDVDRGVYETRALVSRGIRRRRGGVSRPRVLATASNTRRLGFSNGLAEPDGPPLAVRTSRRDPHWIDIGAPDAARMHKGRQGGRARRCLHAQGPGEVRRHGPASVSTAPLDLELYSVSRPFLTALVARLRRRMVWALSVTSGHLYATIDGEVIEGVVERHALGAD